MRFVKIAALATAALLATSATASAAPVSSARALFLIQLTVTGGWSRTVSLNCDPDGGAHPKPVASCALLTAVEGDLWRYLGQQGICTREYQPHTAALTGWWAGRTVHFQRIFANRCEMLLATGSVFDL
ncbi:SSI family serine proteinase inhibitor [Nonomuraea sp. NPDC049152]|uniref:SSI family serine proteinase inhibitor n=1 Tax=Nonomuraea sp. NPDC049152 TaxID=3154350 RepID=UPI0033EC0C1B